MRKVGMHEAKTQFSKLVRAAEAGEEIVVLRGSKPVAQARHLGVPIATADPLVAAYDVAVVEVGAPA